MFKLLYDAYMRGYDARKDGLEPMTFDFFKKQLKKDFDDKQK